eukprot:GFUD01027586.1.p1 GENE.GFUD01027586.1~~GFUD01027586.1.p1  ORF type:complete len:1098 (+),score=293.63 GFUD01027586.1:126-3419(+)
MKHSLFIIFHLVVIHHTKGEIEEIVAQAGDEVLLSCPVNTPECGDFHSLKWYRDTSRMYVYSPAAMFSNAEGTLIDRCLDISQRSLGPACSRGYLEVTDTNADLKITPIETKDEGEYRCEITYLDVSNNCPVVHFTNLRTVAAPEYVSLSLASNPDEDISGQVVGPYSSGSEVAFTCESGGGKPAPSVSWKFGEEEDLEEETTITEDILTGSITVKSVVVVALEQENSGETLHCSVINEVLDEPIEAQVQIDVNVPVKSVYIEEELVGKEDEEMMLTCAAVGGRPMPTISWSLPENVEFETEEESLILEDETFQLISKLTFTPTAEENEKTVTCQAINDVMEEAIEDEAMLDILYAPRVAIEDENKTLTAGDDITIDCLIDANPTNFSLVQWYHNENIIDVEDERFEGGNSEVVSLTINPIIPGDTGDYYCLAENEVGQGISSNSMNLEVLYPPSVQIRIEPEGPVSEEVDVNITLHCDIIDGNPLELSRVSWFLNGGLIREIPDRQCDELLEIGSGEMISDELLVDEGNDKSAFDEEGSGVEVTKALLCESDPTELILQDVTRDFQGYFTCIGSNIAGEGISSEPEELTVHYLPGEAELLQTEEFPVKGGSTVLTCSAEDAGNPEASDFLWKWGDVIMEETSENLTLDNLGLESQENISCSAVNEIGPGGPDTVQLNVFVPPIFIENLPETSSFLSSDKNFGLKCQVECVPLCTIQWMKNEEMITEDDDRYTIEETVIPEDLDANQFTSVNSMFSWNLENLPENKLDHSELNFTISCQVDGNDIGEAISSSTKVTIEYAPENVEISAAFIEIEEGEVMEPLLCFGEGSPEPSITWKFNDEVVSEDSVLEFSEPIKKEQSGDYFCHISNDHGEEVISTTVTVLYKPECTVTYTLMEEEVVLLCTANANPNDLTFWWKKQNDTFDGQANDNRIESEVRLKIINESLGDYFCHVNNSVGEGDACMIELTDIILTKGLSEHELIIIIFVAGAVLALLLVISILVCFYCGKKGKGDKVQSEEGKTPKTDSQPHSDKSFYENLPFHGLKTPPKQVINPRLSENMDYADADYKDLYVEGPMGYRKQSENKANMSKSETNVNGL